MTSYQSYIAIKRYTILLKEDNFTGIHNIYVNE